MARDEGDGTIDVHCDPLGSPLTPLVGLNRESMESNLTNLRLPGLKIGDGQHMTHALGSNKWVLSVFPLRYDMREGSL